MTSNHESVSCNSCGKNNFGGLRYKCLNCYDYDLCSNCYENGLTSLSHTVNHPMQCILAKNDYDLFYAGESISIDQPQSLTCPFCGILGFTESTLFEHVTSEHASSDNDESSTGVVCPICGIEANQLTYDFATHLSMEHRGPRSSSNNLGIHNHNGGNGNSRSRCNTNTGSRGRRSQSRYNELASSSNNTGSSPYRDSTEPLVEILSQLSGVRRAANSNNQTASLHQLQMQLQSSSSFSRNPNEVRMFRRAFQTVSNHMNSTASNLNIMANYNVSSQYCTGNSQPFILMEQNTINGANNNSTNNDVNNINLATSSNNRAAGNLSSIRSQQNVLLNQPANECSTNQLAASSLTSSPSSQYLLSKCMKPTLGDAEQQQREIQKANRSLFVQELLFQLGSLEKIS